MWGYPVLYFGITWYKSFGGSKLVLGSAVNHLMPMTLAKATSLAVWLGPLRNKHGRSKFCSYFSPTVSDPRKKLAGPTKRWYLLHFPPGDASQNQQGNHDLHSASWGRQHAHALLLPLSLLLPPLSFSDENGTLPRKSRVSRAASCMSELASFAPSPRILTMLTHKSLAPLPQLFLPHHAVQCQRPWGDQSCHLIFWALWAKILAWRKSAPKMQN